MTSKNQQWKRHYPLLLLAAGQLFGIVLCVIDLYRRQAALQRFTDGHDPEYSVSLAGTRNAKEHCLFLMSALPNTCEAGATGFAMPLR